MQNILFVIMLFNTQFESFQQDHLIDHYLRFHKIEQCNFNVVTHDDSSFSVYYENKTMIYVNRERIKIYLSDFDFYNNIEINKFLHFFIYNYIFVNEYVYINYSYNNIGTLIEFEKYLKSFIFSGMNIRGSTYNDLTENTKIWTSDMALNNNQMITCIEEIKKKYY